jgi:hypothetical protein
MTKYYGAGIGISCPGCHSLSLNYKDKIRDYVSGKPIVCPRCSAPFDWWSTVCSRIEQEGHIPSAIFFIGARVMTIESSLQVGQRTIFRFSDHGIPVGAKILWVKYHDGPNFLPVEINGNANVASRKFISDQVTLYPLPVNPGDLINDAKILVTVGWMPQSADNDSWQNLVEATESYINGHYPSMIIPANVAVESAMSRLLTGYLEHFVSKERVENFLDNAATYSHQLNVVLPVIASLKSIPLLPEHVRGALNKLRSLRNELSHSGVLEQQLDRAKSAELLCGALFGFHYVQYVEQELLLG